jgi:hypothetical protein
MGAGEAVPASFNMRVAPLVWSNQAPRRLNLGDLIKTLGRRTPKFWAVLRMN